MTIVSFFISRSSVSEILFLHDLQKWKKPGHESHHQFVTGLCKNLCNFMKRILYNRLSARCHRLEYRHIELIRLCQTCSARFDLIHRPHMGYYSEGVSLPLTFRDTLLHFWVLAIFLTQKRAFAIYYPTFSGQIWSNHVKFRQPK